MLSVLQELKNKVNDKEAFLKLCEEKGIKNSNFIYKALQNKTLSTEQTLDASQKRMLKRIDTWTANKITNGLVSSCVGYPVLYDSDRDTQDKLALALGLANAGVLQMRYSEGFPVRGYKQIEVGVYEEEKTVHLFTAEAVIQWNTEFGEHLKKCTAEGWAKQAEVNACTTIEEVNAIVLE